jgi:hypothetical protein
MLDLVFEVWTLFFFTKIKHVYSLKLIKYIRFKYKFNNVKNEKDESVNKLISS